MEVAVEIVSVETDIIRAVRHLVNDPIRQVIRGGLERGKVCENLVGISRSTEHLALVHDFLQQV